MFTAILTLVVFFNNGETMLRFDINGPTSTEVMSMCIDSMINFSTAFQAQGDTIIRVECELQR